MPHTLLPSPIASRRLPLGILSAAALSVLTACGGGGGGGPEATTSAVPTTPAASTTFSGTLKDATTGLAVAGATVSVGVKDSANPVSTTTGTDGAYALKVDTARLNTDSAVVLAVVASSYRPCVVEIKGLSSAGGTTAVTDCATLSALPAGSYAPAEGATITRLGDGTASTSEANNGRLTTLSAGTSKEIKVGAVNATTAGANLGFTLRLKMRGMEAACANKVTIYQTASTPLLVASGGAGGSLVGSDIRGEFSSYEFRLPTSSLAATGDLFVRVESGACTAAPADPFDDFEFYDVTGSFTAALPPT